MNSNAQKWLDALRSDEYKQGNFQLKDGTSFCCLGVACEVYRKETGNGSWNEQDVFCLGDSAETSFASLPPKVAKWIGAKDKNLNTYHSQEFPSAICMNDSRRMSFKEIADFIEKNESKYFGNYIEGEGIAAYVTYESF